VDGSRSNGFHKADAVFEGGGVKGIGLAGALEAFEAAGFRWQNVAGTSAGAITAALVAADYSAREIRRVMDEDVDFARFMDPTPYGRLPWVGPWLSLLFTRGMFQGDYFLATLRRLLSRKFEKEYVTFGDLILPKEPGDSEEDYCRRYKYRLRVVVSDLTCNELLVLPQDAARLGHDPDTLEVALAVRMSMSIPFFFRPVVVQDRHADKAHWLVDGGMLSNFPIRLFDAPLGEVPAWPTFGFLLAEPGSDEPANERIRGLVSMTRAMVHTMNGAHDRKALAEADKRRIVKVPTGAYRATDFRLTKDGRDWLYDSGYRAAEAFLREWSFAGYITERAPETAERRQAAMSSAA
jgi:NTE family protein